MEEGNSIADGPAEDVVKLFEACSDMPPSMFMIIREEAW